jgi:molecular chaperone GrpE (heat shock protein)
MLEHRNAGEGGSESTLGDVVGTSHAEHDTRLGADHDDIEAALNIEDTLRAVADSVQELRDDFSRHVQGFDHQRALVDKLHDENEQLRRVELERSRDPVVRDLISLADTCVRNGRAWGQRDAVTPGDVGRVLREVADDVELILERQGVEAFKPECGTSFDRREHRVVRSADTSDVSLNGVIAEVLKPGYRMGNRIIRYCEVVVWAALAAPAHSAEADDARHSQAYGCQVE